MEQSTCLNASATIVVRGVLSSKDMGEVDGTHTSRERKQYAWQRSRAGSRNRPLVDYDAVVLPGLKLAAELGGRSAASGLRAAGSDRRANGWRLAGTERTPHIEPKFRLFPWARNPNGELGPPALPAEEWLCDPSENGLPPARHFGQSRVQ